MTLLALSEFARDSAGKSYGDCCGPDAETVAVANGRGQVPSADVMHAIRQRDIIRGWFTPGGGNTIQNIYDDLTQIERVTVRRFLPYAEPFDLVTAREVLNLYAGVCPIIIELGLATNLPFNESGVHYHFVCLLAKIRADTFLMANGDDVDALAGNVHPPLREVTFDQLVAAHLCAVIVVNLPIGSGVMGIPSGWTDDGTTLIAPNKVPVIGAIRDFVLAHNWDPSNEPVVPEHPQHPMELGNAAIGDGKQQEFNANVVEWSPTYNNGAPFFMWCGRELQLTRLAYNDAKSAADSAEQRLAIANQTIIQQQQQLEDLTAQIEALHKQLANVGLDTTAILAIRAALAAKG